MTAAAAVADNAAYWQCSDRQFSRQQPLIMGVINITPDSFSDGGIHNTAQAAYAHAMALLEQGADILDVGGESTRPGAAAVGEEEEKRRILPLIERLAAAGAVVSADTMKPAVMTAALDAGAAIINDVNGFCADGAVAAVAARQCGLVVMHKQGTPQTMQAAPDYNDVVSEVSGFLQARTTALMAAGVARQRLCVDPGLGFGKTRTHNVTLINHLARLSGGFPVLAGISRKSIFAALDADLTADKRDTMSAVAAALLLERGAYVLRVHNVQMTKQAVATWRLVQGDYND